MFPPKFPLSLRAALGLGALASLAAVPAVQAQTDTYDAQIPFSFSSPVLASPRGIAVAPDGTVYLADPQTGVVRITPTTGTVGGAARGAASLASTAVTLTPSIAIPKPTAVAVDSTGALYVSDGTDGVVIEMASPETSSAATPINYPGGETPTALAVDSAKNLYIADEKQGAIYKVVSGTATELAISPSNLEPVGLAVDSAGDVYFADARNNEVYEYTASTASTAVYLTTSTAGAFQFSAAAALPIGMGFDPAGSLYILDNGSGNLTQVTSPLTSNANVQLPLSSITPSGLAVSSIGNLYVSDDSANTADEVFYNNNPFNFGSLVSGTNSPAVTVNFQFASQSRGVATYESMQGDVTTEFHTLSSTCPGTTGACSMAFYVDYSSTVPGIRAGVVGLTDNAGHMLVVPTTGISLASGLALYPGTQATLHSSQTLYEPQALAVTGHDGTLFVGDEGGILTGGTFGYTHGGVWAYQVTAGTPGTTATPVGSFATPMALALDPAGNLYVADYSGSVTKVPVSGNTASGNTWTKLGTALTLTGSVALNHPMALAFDPSGNLYIGDMGPGGAEATVSNPGYIIEVPANGGPAVRLNESVGGVPIVFPQALAADAFGNLYIADGGDGGADQGGVDVIPVSTGVATAISFGSFAPLSQPSGLSFDAANDLYVLDGYNQRVLVVPMTFTGTLPAADTSDISLLGQGQSGITSTLVTPSNLVVWPGGQYITISDIGYQTPSGPSSPAQVLTLQSVNATVDPYAGPVSLTGVNVGNEEIHFEAPGNTNPSHLFLSGCGTNSTTLAIGVAPVCSPTVSLAASGGSGTITLNGTLASDHSALGNQIIVAGPDASLSMPTISFSPNVTATLTNNGNGPLVISNIQVTGKAILAGGGTCSTATPVAAGNSCTVNITITSTLSTGTVTVTDNSGNVAGSTQTAHTLYLISIGLALPAGGGLNTLIGGGNTLTLPPANVPRNLLDRTGSAGSNNSNANNSGHATNNRKGHKE